MDKFNTKKLEQIIGSKVESNLDLYKRAFIHRSYLNETTENNSNERLEFLGDAVLQLLTSQFLFKTYTNDPEGILTAYRAALVNTVSLAEEAKRLGYGELLFMSKGEEATGGRDREYILANTFESLLGALYLDKGLEFCDKFLHENLFYKIDKIIKNEDYKDKKSLFQEVSQEKYSITPIYKVLSETGPDHDKTFEVGVYLDTKLIAKGKGSSKQKAESSAAENALNSIKKA